MSIDDREVVTAIRGSLAERLGADRYEVWFGTTAQLALHDERLLVSVPSQFHLEWLRVNFRRDLEAAAETATGRPVRLEFCVDPAAMLIEPQRAIEALQQPQVTVVPAPAPADSAAENDAAVFRPRRGCLKSFVVGSSNCLAYQAAQIAAEKPGSYSPLFVYGPSGAGKTHLLEGVQSAYRGLRPRAAAVYLSAEQFTTHFLEALHGSGLPSFRRKYRGLELMVIDDLQFFANKRATLVELVHTIDTLLRDGRQLVFAADRSPAAFKAISPELAARLAGGMTCRIEQPEFATRLGIVRQWAARLEMSLPDEVATYVASHLTTQSRELAGALKRLHATSLAHRRPINLALAEEALAELIDHQGRAVKLADIERAICDVFGLTAESLQSTRKAKAISHPRMLAMWLARKHTRAALSEIGAFFGRRSHSTVISAQKKVESWMAQGAALELDTRTVNLEETIRRIEEKLRAGVNSTICDSIRPFADSQRAIDIARRA